MAEKKQPNLNVFNKGLHQDNSHVDQPKGTYRFALNSVNETELGDFGFISNEESNEVCYSITPGYIPLGKCYIGDNKVVIFSVSSNNEVSEIGILDDNCNYEVVLNDVSSSIKDKLNFKVSNQIQATYRLRRGCERTLYFTDGLNPPRYFNLDKPNQFKRGTKWASAKFSLYKKLEVFPTIDTVEVLNNQGSLIPGSYTILVQHLDEDLNGTEFYELVKDINIYNDSTNKNYADIQGSSNIGDSEGAFKYHNSTKAIKIVLDMVDKSFTYLRFAFVERNSGTGLVSSVKYSDNISINNPIFIYTGVNAKSTGTIEEVELFNLNSGIQTAKHIDQIDNMLILSNVSGDQSEVCKLQKYASKVKVDCFVKDIILTSNEDAHNPKNPLVVHNGLGYQPGEIYSLGLVYIFDDYTVSPAFHIPGKSDTVDNTLVYSPATGVYPMSNKNNKNISEVYLDENSSCPSSNYWGIDSEGATLKNTNVRHHRFPTRDEIGIDFVKRLDTNGSISKFKRIQLNLTGEIKKSDETYTAPNFILTVKYKKNGVEESFQDTILPDSNVVYSLMQSNIFLESDNITDIKVFYKEVDSATEQEIVLTDGESETQPNNLVYKLSIGELNENNITSIYTVPILGLKLSNVELPTEEEIGKKVIGYQVVRQERKEIDKTILDSAVIFPMLKSGRNVSTALLAPEYYTNSNLTPSTCEGSEDSTYPTCYNVSKKHIMLLTPEHKFRDKTFDGFTSIEQVGTFQKEYLAHSAVSIQNIYEGTSASGDEDKKTRDDDGFSLRHGYRFTGVKYKNPTGTKINITNESIRMYNLQAINYADTENSTETLYNLSSDNKALILSSSKEDADLRTYRPGKHEFPYVYIKNNNNNFYQNFRGEAYYLASTEVFTENSCKIFGGDTYVSPMRYSNHVFGNAAVALRRKKLSVWAVIGSILIALVGIALAVFSGSSSLLIAGGILTALGAVATGTAAMIEVAKFTEIYGDKWEKNLDKTVFDFFYASLFIREHPYGTLGDSEPDKHYLSWQDDTFRWMGDIVGDFWFETQLNISLRVPPTNMENNYLQPLKTYMSDRKDRWLVMTLGKGVEYISNNTIGSGRFHRFQDLTINAESTEEWYFIRKIAKTNSTKPSGLEYLGISTPQIYLVNPDHYVTTGIKKFYTIPLEYDCCSDCREKFPHRVHYSQQSFQEEKADNYRMFLPNNYRDIEGETGEIINVFRLYNNLYVHTEEALWQMGRNYQERVTDQVVSFIGTGSYFEIPPQKVVDDNTGSSAGTQHKWSSIKTPNGYFFVSENQRKIYQFSGKNLNPISDIGISNWFKNNIEIKLDKAYNQIKKENYPFRDNPSNPVGTGFISTYDTRKERLIFTKRDIGFDEKVLNPNNLYCLVDNTATIFYNYQDIISNQASTGWTYLGLENCKMKFSKEVTKYRKEKRYVTQSIFKDVDYLVFRYNFSQDDGRDLDTRTQLLEPFQSETLGWCQNHINTPYIAWASDNTGYGIEAILLDIKKFKEDYPNNDKIVFNAKAWWYGERHSGNMNMNAEGYKGGTMNLQNYNFVNVNGELQGMYSFQTINIPLDGQTTCNPNPTNIGNFTYEISTGKLSWDGVSGGEIPPETTTIEIEVEVPYIDLEYRFIEGVQEPMEDLVATNNSWTISYSLKTKSWISWHSYIPNMYINVPEKFYSWVSNNNTIWKHNVTGKYQTYYGKFNPHIIEYVSLPTPVVTKIWESLNLQTEAKTYDTTLKQFVDDRYVTHNKMILYNTRQCSGLLDLEVRGLQDSTQDYLYSQVSNIDKNNSIIDRRERDWFINDFRDIRIDYTKPIWISNPENLQGVYYVDKVLNESSLNSNKDWSQLESFSDKYLSIRLIFDNFANKKLITNFSIENEDPSLH